MSEVMQFLEATFKPLVLVFTVLNLATVGLRARMPGVVAVVKNKKVLTLIFVWGWVLGPAVGLLIATMAVMWTVWSIAVAAIAARIFAKLAGETAVGGVA